MHRKDATLQCMIRIKFEIVFELSGKAILSRCWSFAGTSMHTEIIYQPRRAVEDDRGGRLVPDLDSLHHLRRCVLRRHRDE